MARRVGTRTIITLALENISKLVGAETYIDDVPLELVEGSFNV